MSQDRRAIKQIGSGRRSMAMGDQDPRSHRADQALGSPQAFRPPLTIDSRGRLGVEIGEGLDLVGGALIALPGTVVGAGGDQSVAYADWLRADLNITADNTWFTGPSVSLGVGVWLVMAQAVLRREGAGETRLLGRLAAGGNAFASALQTVASASDTVISMSLVGSISLPSPSDVSLEAAATAGSTAAPSPNRLLAQVPNLPQGQNATNLVAVRLRSVANPLTPFDPPGVFQGGPTGPGGPGPGGTGGDGTGRPGGGPTPPA